MQRKTKTIKGLVGSAACLPTIRLPCSIQPLAMTFRPPATVTEATVTEATALPPSRPHTASALPLLPSQRLPCPRARSPPMATTTQKASTALIDPVPQNPPSGPEQSELSPWLSTKE